MQSVPSTTECTPFNVELTPVQATPKLDRGSLTDMEEIDETIPQATDSHASLTELGECCLVQIYPVDVVAGMLLLESPQFVIGREHNADLVLADASVSRQHAMLMRDSNGYAIRDLNSTNGSLVNGQRITEQILSSGDTLQLGSFIFKFLASQSVESKYHETIYSAMTRDALTGAMNKRYLLETLNRELLRSVRQGLVLSLVMLDIDHFKRVNDTYGHLVGDEVLREFGNRISSACRGDDMLARYGGEEFVLVLSSTPRIEALEIAERCRQSIAETPFATTAGKLPISASFGVYSFQSTEDSLTQCSTELLIQEADRRLYEAKNTGRNRVVG